MATSPLSPVQLDQGRLTQLPITNYQLPIPPSPRYTPRIMWRTIRQWWHGRFSSSPTPAGAAVLHAIAHGHTLKSHRHLDGQKTYRLHPLEGEAVDVPYEVVQALLAHKYLTTNQKFPSATFLLTNKGKLWVTTQGTAVRGLGEIVDFEG